ncbi:Asp23/Gls24 family envelope stress response protein [Deinococcus radiomollis]|uniref:Asp23/Gls24 family envelope stress response protein n=1 Tax=Deinococcus radiomollis TaxID=468916 RepID=UPI00389297D7
MSGSIHITEGALAALIGLTAHEIPGVVGMAPANLREGIQRVLGRGQSRDGVVIGREGGVRDNGGRESSRENGGRDIESGAVREGGRYTADLYVVVAYGVSIPTVASNIVERVEHVVRSQAGIELAATRVHAVGVSHA